MMKPERELKPSPNCDLAKRCPVCGAANVCRLANGCTYKGPCWCENVSLAPEVLRHLRDIALEPSCLCRDCLLGLARREHSREPLAILLAQVRAESAARAGALAENSYVNAQGYTVFTAAGHWQRGYCCGNGCRFCPYLDQNAANPLL
jgi:hypothetical protein